MASTSMVSTLMVSTLMASTSTSTIKKSFKYDVFLSFRGEDTRKNFVDHLYYALTQKGVETYKDDESIKQGKMISNELFEAIEDSKFYIIIFSKTYASSSWCLEELAKIMECQMMDEHTAYPVFFDVEPTEVRKQSGLVGKAFAINRKKDGAGNWREAMNQLANLAGWEVKNTENGHEAKVIRKIVEKISLELRFTNTSVDEKLVGMDSRIFDVLSYMLTGVNDVCMIGIKGMGGIGKTTLARAVLDQISFMFEGQSFVENVREVSKSLSGLKKLQKQILSDILNDKGITVSGVLDGINMMKTKLRGRKVLIVLDDVDSIDQLEALAGERKWFKPGSMIIITTRDEQVLMAHQVMNIHNVKLLSEAEAICLFSKYAFGTEIPVQGYEQLADEVVQYAHGLPLTVKVLGSLLCGKDKQDWEDALKRLKKIPLKRTMEVLELSYNDLEEDHKEMFLDVACTLNHYEKETAIVALESRGFNARIGLRVLEQKSLITFDNTVAEVLGMHDHLEEMGRNIVQRLHPSEPFKRSRLWNYKEIEDILTNNLGTEATKCLYHQSRDYITEIAMKGLANMKDLEVAEIWFTHETYHWKFDTVGQYFPSSLRFLRTFNFPFSSFPNTFQGNNLVGIDIYNSSIVKLWEDGEEKVLHKLKFLSIGLSKFRTFDLRLTPNLERLIIHGCQDFLELHMPAKHPNLVYLSIYDTKLKTLHLVDTPNLKELFLLSCNNLVELHLGNTPNLEKFLINECNDLVVSLQIASPKLEHLVLCLPKLKTLHLGDAPNLEDLTLKGCNDLVEFQMPGRSQKLMALDLIDNLNLKIFRLGITPNLEDLSLTGCKNLVEFQMPVEILSLKSINLGNDSKLKTLDLGLTPNLRWLYLENCYDLEEINAPVGCLKNLDLVELSGWGRFKSFVFDKRLESSSVDSLCSELHLISEPTDVCPFHSENISPKFKFSCHYKEKQANVFGNLEKLFSLGRCACINPESFSESICGLNLLRKLKLEGSIPEVPKDYSWLAFLEELTFISTDIKILPDSICTVIQLKSLEIVSCFLLEKLPEDLGQLQCLEKLILTDCKILQDLPNSICNMKSLISLHLDECSQIMKLPEGMQHLDCLKEVDITRSGISYLPTGIFQLEGLRIVGEDQQLQSFGFTSEIQISENKATVTITDTQSSSTLITHAQMIKRLICFCFSSSD